MYLFHHTRDTLSLDGTWQAVPDTYRHFRDRDPWDPDTPDDASPHDVDLDEGWSVPVPSSFGEEIPEYRHYEGPVWYARRFSFDGQGDRVFLHVGAANYEAEGWLNGDYLGSHEGGYTPFAFEVTDALVEGGGNFLVVRVDNTRVETGVPALDTDWFNFNGITRSVELVPVPETFVRNFKVETELEEGAVTVRVRAWIDGPDPAEPTVAIPGLGVETGLEPAEDGEYVGTVTRPRGTVDLWSLDDPRLYDLTIECGEDAVRDRVGLREIGVEDGAVRLNGESVWLRGVSLHEEADGAGRALDRGDVRQRFRWLSQLGCNFARLAHYPHTQEMARMADEEGILLWEEVPVYWDVAFGDETVRTSIRRQVRELVQRDWNRASVGLWSIANETDHEDSARNDVLPDVADVARDLDDTRLITAACFIDEAEDGGLAIEDPLEDHLDVIGINEYYGWYYGEADDMAGFDGDPEGTPVIVSEVGAGAKWGNHGAPDEQWTEEYQARVYREQIDALQDNPQIAGMSPWILFDFRTPHRMNEFQRGYNRKGLLDESGKKKRAFRVLADFYRDRAGE